MTPDRREILRHLADLNPRGPRTARAIAAACTKKPVEVAQMLAGLETIGLVEMVSVRATGWQLTPKGRNHVETRMTP